MRSQESQRPFRPPDRVEDPVPHNLNIHNGFAGPPTLVI
jgi:hypothetical protein